MFRIIASSWWTYASIPFSIWHWPVLILSHSPSLLWHRAVSMLSPTPLRPCLCNATLGMLYELHHQTADSMPTWLHGVYWLQDESHDGRAWHPVVKWWEGAWLLEAHALWFTASTLCRSHTFYKRGDFRLTPHKPTKPYIVSSPHPKRGQFMAIVIFITLGTKPGFPNCRPTYWIWLTGGFYLSPMFSEQKKKVWFGIFT